jgi:hypothetical protein
MLNPCRQSMILPAYLARTRPLPSDRRRLAGLAQIIIQNELWLT